MGLLESLKKCLSSKCVPVFIYLLNSKTKNMFLEKPKITPEALKSLYRSPGYKKNQLVLCKNYVLQW